MSYKILAADPSPSSLKAIHLAFQGTPYDVFTSEDGINAVELLMQIRPDAAVIGLSLSGKDGYQIAAFLKSREHFKNIPLILLTDAFESPDKEKLKPLRFDALLQKPIDSEALAHLIRTKIGERHTPETLPEEPESSLEASQPVSSPDDKNPAVDRIEELIRERVGKEILEVERELEKRIYARVRAELKKNENPAAE